MPRVSINDLNMIRENAKSVLTLRTGQARAKITVNMGDCSIAAGSRNVMRALLEEIENRNVTDVIVTVTGCTGLCIREPIATVEVESQAPVKYTDLNPEKIVKVLKDHILEGRVVSEYALANQGHTAGGEV